MYTESEIVILAIVPIFFLAFFVIPVVLETMKERKERRLNFLRYFSTNIIRITKKDANFLLKNCTDLAKTKSCFINSGTAYFMWEEKLPAIGWIENSAGIRPKSLLIAKPYNVANELRDENRNKGSRLLIFKYGTGKEDACYILRHVWAMGKVDKLDSMIKDIFSQEQFKFLVERNSSTLLEPSELVEQLEIQAETAKTLDVEDVVIVSEYNANCVGTLRKKVSLKLYPIQDCYQVTFSVCCAEERKKKN